MTDWSEITANGLWPAPGLAGGVEGPDRRLPVEAQVEMCARWIWEKVMPAKRVAQRPTSYGLKHEVERWSRSLSPRHEQVDDWGRPWVGEYFYVSNGAFIEAARRLGYRILRDSKGSPNARFNMKRKQGA